MATTKSLLDHNTEQNTLLNNEWSGGMLYEGCKCATLAHTTEVKTKPF